MERKPVTIYTDGATEPNPGPGGFGVVLLAPGGYRKELVGGLRVTTNNLMELLAAIKGLEALNGPRVVTLYSDSQYLVRGIMEGWARRWREKGWQKNQKEMTPNADLWARLLDLCTDTARSQLALVAFL